jgi:hypothetical protein
LAKVPGTSRPSTALWSSSRFHRQADRAGGHAVAHDVGHRRDVVVGGGLVGGAALAHHERAHGPCGICAGDVERAGDLVDRVEVLADRLPVPPDRLAERRARNALDALHEPDEPVVAVGRGRREADAAVAHHHGGDAVPQRRREQRVPGGLAVVVRVHVDEAGGHHEPVASISRRPGSGTAPTRGDAIAVDGDVGRAHPAHRVPSITVPLRMTMSCTAFPLVRIRLTSTLPSRLRGPRRPPGSGSVRRVAQDADEGLRARAAERLQEQLVQMQYWVRETGARVVVVFEGRDAAGKGGAIRRIIEYLNPAVRDAPSPGCADGARAG